MAAFHPDSARLFTRGELGMGLDKPQLAEDGDGAFDAVGAHRVIRIDAVRDLGSARRERHVTGIALHARLDSGTPAPARRGRALPRQAPSRSAGRRRGCTAGERTDPRPSRPARPLIWLNSISLNGMLNSTTCLMSGMFTPSPNADVDTRTESAPERNISSMRVRSARSRPAL